MGTKNLFKISKDDFAKAVRVELSLEEMRYLQALLIYEMVYQTKTIVSKTNEDATQKTIQIMGLWDVFRTNDDTLVDFMYMMNSQADPNIKNNIQVKTTVVLNKTVAKLYGILCSETTKLKLDDKLKVLKDKYNSGLLDKLSTAIEASVDVTRLDQTPDLLPKKELEEVKEEDGVKFNIFTKGKASA